MEFLPDSPTEQHRVLGDDRQLAAEIGQSDVTDVDAVDLDGASTALHQPEQNHAQGRLPCTQTDRMTDRMTTESSSFKPKTCGDPEPRPT